MSAKKVTPKNLRTVLSKLATFVLDDPDEAKAFCADLNEWLDALADDDYFGTEKQFDPRGDQRK